MNYSVDFILMSLKDSETFLTIAKCSNENVRR